jgi:hypothetical protein
LKEKKEIEMAKKRKKKGTKAHRGHKPLKLLVSFRNKMEKNIVKLDGIITKRRAAGER